MFYSTHVIYSFIILLSSFSMFCSWILGTRAKSAETIFHFSLNLSVSIKLNFMYAMKFANVFP